MREIPEGFQGIGDLFDIADTFEKCIGPTYYRETDAGYEFGVWVERHHSNVRGTAHGGFMTAVSDMTCGLTTHFHFDESMPAFVTVSMSYQFIGAVPIGSWLRSLCKIRKAGRSTVFVESEHFVGDDLVGASQAVMKTTRSSR
ncbi:MAG: PaaI family thioesterase [Rhodocyclaceae bacterium]|nr:PaaI family thioesterase [Rhodocyclaceae bacterium]